MAQWRVERAIGDAGEFHGTDPVAERSATFWDVERPTLVLGSSQPRSTVDDVVAPLLEVAVVSRRSGGGGVLLVPGEFVWLDLVVPRGDPLWSDDVGRSMLWVGELWSEALAVLGHDSEVHAGPMRTHPWSKVVCWAGLGTGEVVHGDAKVVGVSQRRTREFVRLQSMCHLRWRPDQVAALVAPPRPSIGELTPMAWCPPTTADDLRTALLEALAHH